MSRKLPASLTGDALRPTRTNTYRKMIQKLEELRASGYPGGVALLWSDQENIGQLAVADFSEFRTIAGGAVAMLRDLAAAENWGDVVAQCNDAMRALGLMERPGSDVVLARGIRQ